MKKPHRTCGALEEGHTGKDGNTINHTFRPDLQKQINELKIQKQREQ